RSADEMRLSGLNRVWDDAHNEYLQAAAELGIPGLALLLLFVIAAVRDVIRAFEKTHAPENLAFIGGLAIAMVALLVNAAFRSPFHNPAASIAFVFAAAAAGRLGPRRPFDIRHARRTTILMPAIVLAVLVLFSVRPLVADRWYRTALASQRAAERAADDVRQAMTVGLADRARHAQTREREALEVAARSLAQACEIERGNVEYRYRLALYLSKERLNRVDEERARLREALALHPNFVEALNNLGKSFADAGEWADAESAFKKAEAIGPPRWDVLLNLALVYANQEEWQQAKDYVGRARALDPENTQIRDAQKKLEGH
ncbi:MAG: O-antigen ligase family protein, partial [Planctomycetes bacterium]|nr:O-antigen ligase family protein [Planctomycetota bacterium]